MTIYVEQQGEGEAVVLLHSGGMSGRQWRKLRDALSASYRVVLPDFLGSGANPPWPEREPFEFSADVDAVGEVIARETAPVHLVGHSYGGLVALTLARTIPRAIRSLAVYDPVAFGVIHDAADQVGLDDLAQAGSDPLLSDETKGGSEAWLELFVDYWNGRGSWRALPEPSREAFLRGGRKTYLEVSSLMRDRTPLAAYSVVSAPCLLLTGARSPAAAGRVVELLSKALPHAERQTVEGAGHMGPITHAADVNDAIAKHIERSAVSKG